MRKPRILIADDNSDLVKALAIRLEQKGYEILTATDGYNALAKAKSEAPDLLILDINMPAGDGFSVQTRMEGGETAACQPVIYITGDTSEQTQARFDRLGAFALHHKPIHLPTLLGQIRRALSAKAA